jgi:SAM-dependent methyltransferase
VVSTGPSTGNPSPCSTLPQSGLKGTEITSEGTDTSRWYGEDLAYIHDVGHAEFALGAAPGIMEVLDRDGIHEGLVVDLGCGSGLWARELVDAGYRVLGIDISEAMIELSRNRVPEAEFRVGSLFEVEIPRCQAVTAVSEVLNYLFDAENEERGLGRLVRRVHDALVPGGVFVFDVLGPGQVPPGTRARGFRVGEDWAVLAEREEDVERGTMERRIVSFRKAGELYRRDDEVHRVRLYDPSRLSAELEQAGFRVRTVRSYGAHPLSEGHIAFVARKPA